MAGLFDDLLKEGNQAEGGTSGLFDDIVVKQDPPSVLDTIGTYLKGALDNASSAMRPKEFRSVLESQPFSAEAERMVQVRSAVAGMAPEERVQYLRQVSQDDGPLAGAAAELVKQSMLQLSERDAVDNPVTRAAAKLPVKVGTSPASDYVALPADVGTRIEDAFLKPREIAAENFAIDRVSGLNATALERAGADKKREADLAALVERNELAERRKYARENPGLAGLAVGSANVLSGTINTPGVAADWLNQGAVNPVLQLVGLPPMERVPLAMGTEYLAKAAAEYTPAIADMQPEEAWKADKFGAWSYAQLAIQAPQLAQLIAGGSIPALRKYVLAGMGAQAAGMSYAAGDDSRIAAAKGAVEVVTEMLPFKAVDKVIDAIRIMPAATRGQLMKTIGQQVVKSAAILATSVGVNTVEEATAEFGGNLLDKYAAGKNVGLMDNVVKAGVIGGLTGVGFSAPGIVRNVKQQAEGGEAAAALSSLLDGGQFAGQDAGTQSLSADAERAKNEALQAWGRYSAQSPSGAPAAAPTPSAPRQGGDLRSPLVAPASVQQAAQAQQERAQSQQSMADIGAASTVDEAIAATQRAIGSNQRAVQLDSDAMLSQAMEQAQIPQEALLPYSPATEQSAAEVGGVAVTTEGLQRYAPEAVEPSSAPQSNPAPALAEQAQAATEAAAKSETIWTGRSGNGYATQADAQRAQQERTKTRPMFDWTIRTNADGRYVLAGVTRTQQDGQNATATTTAGTGSPGSGQRIQQLASAFERIGVPTKNLREATPAALRELEVSQPGRVREIREAARAVNEIGNVTAQAFGWRAVPVLGMTDSYGVQYQGQTFMDVEEISMGDARGNSISGLAIQSAGHETAHNLEKSTDPLDVADYKVLRRAILKNAKPGVVQARIESEDRGQAYGENEIVADVSGDFWIDPKFWERMYDLDSGAFRRIAYKLMENASKLVQAVKGSRLDASRYINNIDQVREIAAQVWASKAGRSGPLFSTKSIQQSITQEAQNDRPNTAEARDGRGRQDSSPASRSQVPEGQPREAEARNRGNPKRAADGRLEGAASVRGFSGPDPRLVAVAQAYAKSIGLTLKPQAEYAKVDEARARRIAEAYEQMEHAPQDAKVKEAYANLIEQTVAQYRALERAGYKFWFIDISSESGQEYASTPWNAMRDIRANKTMGSFPTSDGFGSSDLDVSSNPLLADTGIKWPFGSPAGELKPVLANDLFRVVHDAFGHGLEGAGFRADGEENAWQAHVRLFTGTAVGAITSETRGQNSFLNFGPNGESNQTAKVEDTVFADQKTGLMPAWTWTEGRVGDEIDSKTNQQEYRSENADTKPGEKSPATAGQDGVRDGAGRPDEASRSVSGAAASENDGPARPSYGRARKGSSRAVGVHFSKIARTELDSSFYGTGMKGDEARRLEMEGDIRPRVYFYVDTGQGVRPEAGVGGIPHEVVLENLYDVQADDLYLVRGTRGMPPTERANAWERAIMQAGFDGYLSIEKDSRMGFAVLVGKHNVPVARATPKIMGALAQQSVPKPKQEQTRESGEELVRRPVGDEMLQVIKAARGDMKAAAPSFRLLYGEARVLKSEAEFADVVLAQYPGGFQFGELPSRSATDAELTTKQGRILRSLEELTDAAINQGSWKNWYNRHEAALEKLFSDDAPLFQKILSATSQATGVKGNVTLALKAYDQLLSGLPFTGYLPAVAKNLGRIRDDEALAGAKIAQYGEANEGNTEAIAVDRHIAMLFFDVKTPNRAQIAAAKERIREIAAQLKWEPRQVQASLWAFNQVRLGTDPTKVQSYDTILEDRADLIAALRAKHQRGEGRGVQAGSRTGTPADERPSQSRVDQTETENFRRWFADSKVVDDAGQPLAMFHGTSASQDGGAFSIFDTYASNYGLMGGGAYFTADPEVASSYTTKGRGKTPTVYKVYLSIQNPVDMDAPADASAWRAQFKDAAAYHDGGSTNESWYRAAEESLIDRNLASWEGAEIMQDGLRAMGFDGITHIGGGRVKADGIRHKVFIAFDPEQIKSATGNNGKFSRADTNISRSIAKRKIAAIQEEAQAIASNPLVPVTKRKASAKKAKEKIEELRAQNGIAPDFKDVAESSAQEIEDGGGRVVDIMQIDELVDSAQIKVITLQDMVGMGIFPTIADRTAAAAIYRGIDSSALQAAVPLLGGPLFPLRKSNVQADVVWANRGAGVTSQKAAKLKAGANYMMVVMGDADMHISNSTVAAAFMGTLEAWRRDGRISAPNLKKLAMLVTGSGESALKSFTAKVEKAEAEMSAAKTEAEKEKAKKARNQASKSVSMARALAGFPGFADPAVMHSYMDAMSFDARKRVLELMSSKAAQKLGAPPMARILDATREPSLAGHRWGDGVILLEVDQKNPQVDLGTQGTTPHPDFPLGIKGRVVGRLAAPVNWRVLWQDWLAKNADKASPRRAFELAKPVVTVTQELVDRIGPIAQKGISSAQQARLAADFAAGNWSTSDNPVKDGGVSPQEFLDALALSDAKDTLSQYTLKEVTEGVKSGSMKLFQLGDGQIFFMLQYDGAKVTLASVVNNEQGARGIGGPAIVLKAIQEGVTDLDCYAVKSDKFPYGFLPSLYAAFGFEKKGEEMAFDPQYLNGIRQRDAVNYWKASTPGFDPAKGMPGLVEMTWSGTNEERASIVRRYLRSGFEGLYARGAESNARAAWSELADSDRAQAEREGQAATNGRRAGGDQGAAAGASIASGAQRVVQAIARLNPGETQNLGLTEEDVKAARWALDIEPDAPSMSRTNAERQGYDTGTTYYHGTTAGKDFTSFKVGKGGVNELGAGIYVTTDPDVAGAWAGRAGQGGRIMPLWLKRGDIFDASKPVDYTALAARVKEQNPLSANETAAAKIRQKSVLDWTDAEKVIVNEAGQEGLWRTWLAEPAQALGAQIKRAEDINPWLQRAGYIGAKNDNSQIAGQVVVFDSKNIKSATGNNGKYNPDSANISRSRADVERTPEFKAWFGDSKVVDADGKPLVVYHGTRGDFDTFDAGRQGQSDFGASGRGFYFSQDPGTASVYATLSPADGAPNIVPVYLKLENPLELGAMLPQNEEQSRALTEAAKEAGHDGIVVRGADGVLDEVVVFRPEQIKSATGNNGKYNPDSANISRSRADVEGTPEFKAWFGDSKVVDADGKPLVMFHGTGADFSVFLDEKIGSSWGADRIGHFFTTDAKVAGDYANASGPTAQRTSGQSIMPVYLKIERPVSIEALEEFSGIDGLEEKYESPIELYDDMRDDIESMLLGNATDNWTVNKESKASTKNTHDGVLITIGNETLAVAVDGRQIKSSTGNNGDFDGDNPDISRSRRDLQGDVYLLPGETRMQDFRRKTQDYFLRVRDVQAMVKEQGGVLTEQTDVYGAEALSHGRSNAQLQDFAANQVEPLMTKLVKMKVDMDEFSLYAYAMHATERNAYIASIDPAMPDGGSGMTNAEAASILQLVNLSGDQAKFDELHADLMAITRTNRMVMLDEGLITQDEFDALDSMYENYVPLRGFEAVDEDNRPTGRSAGRGFNIRGSETLRALGRQSRAGQLIENVIGDYQRTVVRAERNHVAKIFLNFVMLNPDRKLWEIDASTTRKSLDRQTGRVARNTAIDKGEDTIAVKVAGREIYIRIHDDLVLRAMRKSHADETGALAADVMRTVGLYTSLLRNTLTRYNPEFAIVNTFRDFGFGSVAVLDALGEKGVAKFAAHYPGATAASYRSERRTGDPANREWDRWFEEYRAVGGITGGFYQKGVEEITSDIRAMMVEAGAAPKNLTERVRYNKATSMAKSALRVLEFAGSVSENAARVAAYRTAREMGKTRAEAALLAKGLTTNFDRKGEYGQLINSLFVFYNAAIQGAHKTLQMMRNPKVQAYMAGMAAASVGLAFANALAGGDDPDDGMAYWDKIPDYIKERNLIIMLPPGIQVEGAEEVGTKGRYLTVPMQYGLNIPHVLGYHVADYIRNLKDKTRGVDLKEASLRLASAVAGSFNPFDGSIDLSNPSSMAQAITPSLLDPVVQMATGTNSFGRDVAPFKSPFDNKPDSYNSNVAQAGSPAEKIAQWLNSATGGASYESGLIDVSPGSIENMVRNMTGGTGMFLYDTVSLASKAIEGATGNDPDLFIKQVPLARRLYGETAGDTDQGLFYDRRKKIGQAASIVKGAEEADVEITDPEKLALDSMSKDAGKYTKWLSEIRKDMKEVQTSDMTKGDRKLKMRELRAERDRLTAEFNRDFLEAMREAMNETEAKP